MFFDKASSENISWHLGVSIGGLKYSLRLPMLILGNAKTVTRYFTVYNKTF
jgi:hypothetical protein